jgi:hypothetical protein
MCICIAPWSAVPHLAAEAGQDGRHAEASLPGQDPVLERRLGGN